MPAWRHTPRIRAAGTSPLCTMKSRQTLALFLYPNKQSKTGSLAKAYTRVCLRAHAQVRLSVHELHKCDCGCQPLSIRASCPALASFGYGSLTCQALENMGIKHVALLVGLLSSCVSLYLAPCLHILHM